MSFVAPTWSHERERPSAGVSYVLCARGEHVVHTKRAKQPCAECARERAKRGAP